MCSSDLVGYINVCKMEGRRFTDIGKREPCEIPEYSKENLAICREALLDAVAETSDEFMERYFNGEEFTVSEIRAAMKFNVGRFRDSRFDGFQCGASEHSQSDE